MTYFDSALRSGAYNVYKMNAAKTGYDDVSGRGGVFTGTVVPTASMVSGTGNSLAVFTNAAKNITTPIFRTDNGNKEFSLSAWFLPLTNAATVSILSHDSTYDGLVFDGDFIRFRIQATDNSWSEAIWPVPDFPEAYLVTGVYSGNKLSLYINDTLVAESDPNDSLLNLGMKTQSTPGTLYIGQSTLTTQKFAADGFATYGFPLSHEQVAENFKAGRDVPTMFEVASRLGAEYWDFSDRNRPIDIVINGDTWVEGVMTEVTNTSGDLQPTVNQTTLLSNAGEWLYSVPLDTLETTSMKGAFVHWDGDGNFTVKACLDQTNWLTLTNGEIVPGTFNYNSTANPIMLVKVTFTGGVANDISLVRNLRISAYSDNVVASYNSNRAATVNGDVTTPFQMNEPIEQNLFDGLRMYGGTFVIGQDSAGQTISSVEMWVKLQGSDSGGSTATLFDLRPGGGSAFLQYNTGTGTLTWSGMASIILNRASVSSGTTAFKLNEWNHIIIFTTSVFNTAITFGNDMNGQFGMITLHPLTYNTNQKYDAFFGINIASILDSAVPSIQEDANPFNMYAYSWDISAGG